ncbi:MAG: Ig-like domain-containing protein [Tannerellaceae bacterium]|jgi:hypothetical protein|nr:Ig-like domain-containing protein [Tannerellaceae bacterium]
MKTLSLFNKPVGRASRFFLMVMMAYTFLTGCKEDDTVAVSAVTLLEAKYSSAGEVMLISLKDNATLQLTPFIMPQDASNKAVIYSNKRKDILEVSEGGLITPKAVGTDTLTVTAIDGSGVATSYTVNVTDHKVKATAIIVTAEGRNIKMKIGGAPFNLAECLTFEPADIWDKSVTYQSLDEKIATVSADGMVSPVSIGTTVIRITTADGSNITTDCNVEVLDLVITKVDYDRSKWTVQTSVSYSDGKNYVTDGTTGKPEDMFDDVATTFLSMVKPGKNYGAYSGTSPGYSLSFIVDMQEAQPFDFVRWQHRSNNSYTYLRVWGIDLAGSNDGVSFTDIQAGIDIPGTGAETPNGTDTNVYRIGLKAAANYRYVKVSITKWSDNSGGATSGSTVQIGEFGLGYTHIE